MFTFDVFLSYSSSDQDWVAALKKKLESKGIKVWMDKDEIRPGDIFAEALEKGLKESKAVVLVVSPKAVESEWVKEEYYRALALTKEKKERLQLIPVLLRDAELPGFLSSRQSVVFNNREFPEASLASLIWGITGQRKPLGVTYQAVSSKWIRWVVIGGLLITALIVVTALSLRKQYRYPNIKSISPVAPIANAHLEIYGENFPESPSDLKVLFNNHEAKEIYAVNTGFIDIRVPEEAASGPLRVIKKSSVPLLPDLEAKYVIVSVQRLDRDIVLINEAIDIKPNYMSVGFSIINTTNRRFTLNDIRLHTLLIRDLGAPSYRQERIDLGVYSILKDRKMDVKFLDIPSASLLGKQYVVRLEPRSSESFSFRIQRPNSTANLHFIFAVSVHFFDDNGKQGVGYADRLYNVNVSDLLGFASLGDLPLNQETLSSLQNKYKEDFHSVDLRTP